MTPSITNNGKKILELLIQAEKSAWKHILRGTSVGHNSASGNRPFRQIFVNSYWEIDVAFDLIVLIISMGTDEIYPYLPHFLRPR